MIRQRIRFIGRVQGVGFRYTIASLAKQMGLTGWVKNEWDGSVLSEIQGNIEDIDWIIQQLREDSYIRIQRILREQMPVVEHEKKFRVGY